MQANQHAMGLADVSTLSKEAGYDWDHEKALMQAKEAEQQKQRDSEAMKARRLRAEVGRIQAMRDEKGGRGRPTDSQAANQ